MRKVTVPELAEALHTVTRLLGRTDGQTISTWAELGNEDRLRSAMAINAIMRDSTRTAEELHNLWLQIKVSMGWKYGPVYNLGKLEHPCIISFDRLPTEEKLKDEIWLFLTELFRPYMQLEEK